MTCGGQRPAAPPFQASPFHGVHISQAKECSRLAGVPVLFVRVREAPSLRGDLCRALRAAHRGAGHKPSTLHTGLLLVWLQQQGRFPVGSAKPFPVGRLSDPEAAGSASRSGIAVVLVVSTFAAAWAG